LDEDRTLWHPAFVQALRADLADYLDVLEFQVEHQLTAQPLQIDVVIIKKDNDVVIDKNIASIFRSRNILEYKSPTDSLAVADFYKVYAYACLYIYLEKMDITNVSITLVSTKHPVAVLQHLTKERQYRIEEKFKGIYVVTGDIIPIQLIVSKELSEEDNTFIAGLGNKLDVAQFIRIIKKSTQYKEETNLDAFMFALYQANKQVFREVLKMDYAELDEVFIETGWAARWEARGEVRGEARGEKRGEEKIIELWKSGKSLDEALKVLEASNNTAE
jgi:hypothetical protein